VTVKGGQLSGSFTHRQIFGDSVVSRQGAISGRVSDDGRIKATATGKSLDTTERPNPFTGLLNCPFRADFNGRIDGKTVSGSFNTWDARKKEYITCKYRFSWQATRQ
jgi:hypothetical protein